MELTREQLTIMRHNEGPALVTAGAGCGKTTLLVEYLAQKLRKPGAGQKKILVLTFSNSACEELCTRLHQRLEKNKSGKITGYENVHIMTCHRKVKPPNIIYFQVYTPHEILLFLKIKNRL
jgi:superfamily I DNA/RNA helicase